MKPAPSATTVVSEKSHAPTARRGPLLSSNDQQDLEQHRLAGKVEALKAYRLSFRMTLKKNGAVLVIHYRLWSPPYWT